MRIIFTPEALNDIENNKNYLLDEYGPQTAVKNIKKVLKSIRSLEQFPLQGSGVWEKYGIESDYRYIYTTRNYVFYRVSSDLVRVIRILDVRRDFLSILFGINDLTDDSE
jgi:plasmid stabilization system protein ParE